MSENKQILFVDDETSVLDALRRALRGARDVWVMYSTHTAADPLHGTDRLGFHE